MMVTTDSAVHELETYFFLWSIAGNFETRDCCSHSLLLVNRLLELVVRESKFRFLVCGARIFFFYEIILRIAFEKTLLWDVEAKCREAPVFINSLKPVA